METKVYEESMATGKWYWLRGTEQLPQLGKAIPERGLGALVDGDRYPGGSVLKRYTHSFWFVIPGAAGSVSLYVCVAHIPVYRDDDVSQTERKLAFDEISEGLTLFRGKGLLAVVGDLNSRTAMNGDTALKACGKELLKFCNDVDHSLFIVNSSDELCEGQFTRVVPSVRDGVATLDQTTIDYALVEMNAMNLVRKLTILEETELSPVMSDHRPLLLELNWINNVKAPARSNVAARRCLRLHGRSRHLLNSFEDRLEPQLVQLNAQVEESSIAERWSELKVLFLRAADDHFGTRLIGHASKAWVGGDMKVLFQIRKLARLVSKAACQHDETLVLAARELMDDVTKLLKATQRSK